MSKKNNLNVRITSTGREYIDLSGEKGRKIAREILKSGVFDKALEIKPKARPGKKLK